MRSAQHALRFACQDASLIGILDVPERPLNRGVLMVCGEHACRSGPHRVQTLTSRLFAARGIPVLRFDTRGRGDSEGQAPASGGEQIDITAAMKELFMQMPEMKESVIWAVGDAATPAALYSCSDERVAGLILLNPRAEVPAPAPGAAAQPVRVAELPLWRALNANSGSMRRTLALLRDQARAAEASAAAGPHRLLSCLECFDGHVLFVVGRSDPAAALFDTYLSDRQDAQRTTVDDADATFAARAWRDQAAEACAGWLISW